MAFKNIEQGILVSKRAETRRQQSELEEPRTRNFRLIEWKCYDSFRPYKVNIKHLHYGQRLVNVNMMEIDPHVLASLVSQDIAENSLAQCLGSRGLRLSHSPLLHNMPACRWSTRYVDNIKCKLRDLCISILRSDPEDLAPSGSVFKTSDTDGRGTRSGPCHKHA
jgi:hypothetical protein